MSVIKFSAMLLVFVSAIEFKLSDREYAREEERGLLGTKIPKTKTKIK